MHSNKCLQIKKTNNIKGPNALEASDVSVLKYTYCYTSTKSVMGRVKLPDPRGESPFTQIENVKKMNEGICNI